MNQIMRLLPDLIMSAGGTVVLLGSGRYHSRVISDFMRWVALFFVVAAGVALYALQGSADPIAAEGWILNTPLNIVFGLVFLAIIGWTLIAGNVPTLGGSEYYSLLLFAGVGMLALARSGNLGALFLGLEVMSLALYVLIAFSYERRVSLRAGTMYLILAGFASGFLVFGLALIYAVYGTLDIALLKNAVTASPVGKPVAIIGFGLFLVGVAFKLAVVPFHMWTPEVYEAAPGAVSGVIASASKGAVIAAFIPFLFLLNTHWQILWILAVASMIGGNLLGLRETRVKRILAYSSIGHIGYMLIGYLAGRRMVEFTGDAETFRNTFPHVPGISAMVFYVVAYAMAILGAFTGLSLIEKEHSLTLHGLRGVGRRKPVMAFCILVFVVSLAGLPPTVGFWGKLYLFSAGVNAGYTWLPVLGLIGSAIGIYYYLRILVHLFMLQTDSASPKVHDTGLQNGALVVLAVLVVFFGIFPDAVFRLLGVG